MLSDKIKVKPEFGKAAERYYRKFCRANHTYVAVGDFWKPVEAGKINSRVASESK